MLSRTATTSLPRAHSSLPRVFVQAHALAFLLSTFVVNEALLFVAAKIFETVALRINASTTLLPSHSRFRSSPPANEALRNNAHDKKRTGCCRRPPCSPRLARRVSNADNGYFLTSMGRRASLPRAKSFVDAEPRRAPRPYRWAFIRFLATRGHIVECVRACRIEVRTHR